MVLRDPAGDEATGELGTTTPEDLLVAYDGVKVVAGTAG